MYEKGQIWFLKRPGAHCIIKAIITDITKRTIEIIDLNGYPSLSALPYYVSKERYIFGQLDFIELVEEAQ